MPYYAGCAYPYVPSVGCGPYGIYGGVYSAYLPYGVYGVPPCGYGACRPY